ncbi:stage II sporulation protein M [Candidatus Woesearchaeota archaeon]|nr:stage II sporulation protein M [Candidatus Woesearchaeota archaeon]
MVVESLLVPFKAEKSPWKMFFLGFLYTSIGIFLALWIFKDQASLVMVFMITMAALPVFYNTMKLEESKDMLIGKESALLREHNKAISFFMYMFIGITVACALWYVILPVPTINSLFDKQVGTIQAINNNVSGNVIHSLNTFWKIFFNNFKVLAFSILFAFVYGAGAIFILAWNATVIGAAIGNFIRVNISSYTSSFGLLEAGNYFHVVSLGLLKYSIHGIPEIAAYFYGGLAGGILSVALIRKHFKSEKFPNIMIDFSELVLISVGFLVAAAFLEVYVTPVLF